jgi:hypothetical protein
MWVFGDFYEEGKRKIELKEEEQKKIEEFRNQNYQSTFKFWRG